MKQMLSKPTCLILAGVESLIWHEYYLEKAYFDFMKSTKNKEEGFKKKL
jgi:hypothetical protein